MKRKHFIIVLAMLVLVACQSSVGTLESTASPAPPVGESPVKTPTSLPTATPVVVTGTVRIWHSWEDPFVPALLRAIDGFNELYPSIYFDVLYVPADDLPIAFEQAVQEGHAPSLLIGQAEWGPDLYDKGLVADLSDLISPDLLDTLNPAALGTGRLAVGLISVPVDIRGVVLYRNRSIIPIAPSTFEELASLAKEATRGQTLGSVLDRSFFFSGAHLIGLGGSLMTEEGKPGFNNERGLDWVGLLQAYDQAGAAEFFTDNDLNMFKEGRVGFIIDGTWNRTSLAETIGEDNLAIDPWPIHAGGSLSGFVQAESMFLTPQALDEVHAVSLKFLQFFLSPEAQSSIAEVGLIPAINGSPVNLAANQVVISDPLISQAMRALTDGVTYPVTPEMGIYSSQLDISLKSVFDDGVPAQQALQSAEEAINAALVTPAP